jgi:hypothetical protein
MNSTNARVIVCSHRRNTLAFKIETDGGLIGTGDAPLTCPIGLKNYLRSM